MHPVVKDRLGPLGPAARPRGGERGHSVSNPPTPRKGANEEK